jgi:Tfp pilus assembly protein PilF
MRHDTTRPEAADHAHWDAVEEATELLHEERYHEALVALREVLRKDPQNPYAFYFLGVALYESGELEASRDAYRACLKLAPQHLGARVALCHVLRAFGDLRESIREGMAALSQSPGDPDALHAVGLAYLARGDDAAARRYLEAFLATKPEFEVATEVRATLATLEGPKKLEN